MKYIYQITNSIYQITYIIYYHITYIKLPIYQMFENKRNILQVVMRKKITASNRKWRILWIGLFSFFIFYFLFFLFSLVLLLLVFLYFFFITLFIYSLFEFFYILNIYFSMCACFYISLYFCLPIFLFIKTSLFSLCWDPIVIPRSTWNLLFIMSYVSFISTVFVTSDNAIFT